MKNEIVCNNCGKKSAFYKLNCDHCKAYLRTRIVNIDLWATVYLILESPRNAFEKIIQAEHKNFIIFLTILAGIKIFLFSVMANSVIDPLNKIVDYFVSNMFIFIGYASLVILLFSFIVTRLNSALGLENRFKDNYSIYVYSFVPLFISLVVLSAVHYALFGKYWFTFNPSPFIVKPAVAWIMSIIEVILLVWSILLSIIATYAQTRSKLYSIAIGIMFWLCIAVIVFFIPLLPF